MCDVYVTPYLNESQMTSGTLSYSFGLGKAVVSTPYWHAKELLGDDRGVLVPFGDPKAIGWEIATLLTNDARRNALRKRAYVSSRSMTWAQTAKRYLTTFEGACDVSPADEKPRTTPICAGRARLAIPEFQAVHLLAMCDSTGLLQHAVHSVPDRAHGYCVDDNARALLLACTREGSHKLRIPDFLRTRFAAFIQHAWNPDTQRFRNFMSFERRWLEDTGSEDSHGRTLWALATCAANDSDASRRRWATGLFEKALPAVHEFSSPRAWAFTLLALDVYCPSNGGDTYAKQLRLLLADRLMALLSADRPDTWLWFEDVLAYDNARLCQALIQTGTTTDTPAYTVAGLQSLRWLMKLQTAPSGCFRPIGSHSFGQRYGLPAPFDQQPVEAAAAISACLAAARVDPSRDWASDAMRAFNWFLGANDLHVSLVDVATGSCMDGLHPDRPNRNMGAESVLSYLLGLAEIRRFVRAGVTFDSSVCTPALALSA